MLTRITRNKKERKSLLLVALYFEIETMLRIALLPRIVLSLLEEGLSRINNSFHGDTKLLVE